MIIRGPGVPAGATREQFVLNNDLAPTFAELTKATPTHEMDGQSFAPLLSASADPAVPHRTAFLVEKWGARVTPSPYKALRTEQHLYVEHRNGERELYDLSADPYELQNLYATADPTLIEHLAARLKALRDCAGTYCGTAEDGRSEYEAPTITLATPAKGAAYTLDQEVGADYQCKDEAGGSGLKSCDGPVLPGSPIDTSSVGLKGFTVTAEDNTGNRSSATSNYRVRYRFRGFFEPVNNQPTLNSMEAGGAVSVRFDLHGDQGLDIFTEGYPKSEQISCDPTATIDEIERIVPADAGALSYNPSTGRYAYTWKTDTAWAGTCRQLVMKLKDNSYHRANFRFG